MANEYDKKSEGELIKLLADKRKELQQFCFDVSGSRIKNLRAGRNFRKDIARALTSLRAKSNDAIK